MATTGTALGAHRQVRMWQRMAIGVALALSLAGLGFTAGRMQPSAPTGTSRMVPRPAQGIGINVDLPTVASSAPVTHRHRVKWG